MLKKIANDIARRFGIEIRRAQTKSPKSAMVSLIPGKRQQGTVLLSYTLNPFLRNNQLVDNAHITDWLCSQIAETFLSYGFGVDVIDFTNREFVPGKEYALCIDVLSNLERLAPLLNKACIKILHPAWSHWAFHNTASYSRILALQERRGIVLEPNKLLTPNRTLENADYVTLRGGDFSTGTYKYAQKPIYHIPQPTIAQFPWPYGRNYEMCRNHFLWLGGYGMVHKGLDLVLEAFVGLPECHLTVCGNVAGEKDFETAFYKELYQTPNITTAGWLDVDSPEFSEIIRTCVGAVHPSCSEIQVGAMVTCMHAGLIPIVSYESDMPVGDFGVMLAKSTVHDIQDAVRMIADL
ncbi:MAG: hypothetical protein WA610_08290, partial [Thermodesulfovibrionales bacterium]